MVEVKIITEDLQLLCDLNNSLTTNALAMNGMVLKDYSQFSTISYVLILQTRASLFDDVTSFSKSILGEKLKTIYSTPITNIDWDQVNNKLLNRNLSA